MVPSGKILSIDSRQAISSRIHIRKGQSVYKQVIDLVDIILKKEGSITISDIKWIGQEVLGTPLVGTYIINALMGKDYIIDCRTYTIYRS